MDFNVIASTVNCVMELLRRAYTGLSRTAEGHTRRAQKAFSTVELAISLSLFLMFSTILALAVARGLGASTEASTLRASINEASDLLNQITSLPYDELVSNSFTVPSPCDGVEGQGISTNTCITVNNTKMEFTYQYQDTTGLDGAPQCSSVNSGTQTATTYGFVGFCAKVVSVGGVATPNSEIATKKANSPGPQYSVDGGVVRVRVGGDYSSIPTGSLYLVKEENPSTILGTGVIDSASGMAYIATVGDSPGVLASTTCTSDSPCMLAISPTSIPAQVGNIGLYGATARIGAGITTPKGKVVDAGVSVQYVPTLRIDLSAANGSNTARLTSSSNIGNPAGSVCLWATFADSGTQTTSVCNTGDDPSVISTSSYQVNGMSFPIPVTTVRVTEDAPSGACPNVGQKGYSGAGGFIPAAVCTSWTWGVPNTLPASVQLVSNDTTRLSVVWNADADGLASPAAAWPNDAGAGLWSHPRLIPTCAANASCASVTTAPELRSCPNQYCLNTPVALPVLTAPTKPVIITSNNATTFAAGARSGSKLGTVHVYQLSSAGTGSGSVLPTSPSGIGYKVNGNNVSVGSLIGGGSNRLSWEVTYTKPESQTGPVNIFYRICPNAQGLTCSGGVTRSIVVSGSETMGNLQLDSISASQGGPGHLTAVLTNPVTGKGIAGAEVQFNLNGIATTTSNSTNVTTNGSGTAKLDVTVSSTAPVGPNEITAQVTGEGAASAKAIINVQPTATTITAAVDSSVPWIQGTKRSVTVHATTAGGQVAPNVPVTASVTKNSVNTSTIYPDRGCTTDANGNCTIPINISPATSVGAYTFIARSTYISTAQNPLTLNIIGKLDRIETSNPVLKPGQVNIPTTFTFYDTTGQVLLNTGSTQNNTPISMVGDSVVGPNPPSITPVNVTISNAGTASVNLSVLETAQVGKHVLTFTQNNTGINPAPSVLTNVDISVATAILSQTDVPSVVQGQSGQLSLWVKDTVGRPLAGQVVYFTSSVQGVGLGYSAVSNSEGLVTSPVNVSPYVHSGTQQVTAWLEGQPPDIFSVSVASMPGSVTVNGSIPQGQSSTVVLYLWDTAGDPISGSTLNIGSVSGLSITPPTVTTDANGSAQLTISDTATLLAGTYMLPVSSSGFTQQTPITITARPVSLLSGSTDPLTATNLLPAVRTFTLRDAANVPLGFYPVTVAWQTPSSPNGILSLEGEPDVDPVTTREDGTIDLKVTPTANTPAGTWTSTLSAGPISVSQLVSVIGTIVPAVPNNVSSSGGNTRITASWSTPVANGGASPDSYKAMTKPNSAFRANLVTNPNASTANNWSAVGTGVTSNSVTATDNPYGSTAYTATIPASTSGAGLSVGVSPISQNTKYTASMSVKTDVSGSWVAHLKYYNASGVFISEQTTNVDLPTVNTWTRIQVLGTTSPTNASKLSLSIEHPTAVSSITRVYAAGALVEASENVGSYFDGNTPGAFWSGTVNTSLSLLDTTAKINLIKDPSGSGDTYWKGLSNVASVTSTTSEAHSGPSSLAVTATAAANMTVASSTDQTFTVIPNTEYTAQVFVKSNSTARSATIGLAWNGGAAGQSTATTTDSSTGWTAITVTGTAPATAKFAYLYVQFAGVQAAEVHYLDAAQVVQSPTVSPFFDGSTTNAYWLGLQNASMSVQEPTDPPTASCSTTGLTCPITGLTQNAYYYTRVAAHNGAGWGTISAWTTTPVVIHPEVPTPPRSALVKLGSSGVLIPSWQAPDNDGGSTITSYVASVYSGYTTVGSCTTSNLSCAVFGLTNGSTYTVKVYAINSAGVSPASTATNSIAAHVAPTAPLGVTSTATSNTILQSWTSAASAASPVTEYKAAAKASSYFKNNLVANPSFETGTTDWVLNVPSSEAVVSKETALSLFGAASMKVSTTSGAASGPVNTEVQVNGAKGFEGVVPNASYAVSGWVYAPAARDIYVQPVFYAADSSIISAGGQTVVHVNASTWTRLTSTATAPAIPPAARIGLAFGTNVTNGETVGTKFLLDGVQVEQGSSSTPYFDGSSTGSFWLGTENLSASSQDMAARVNLLPNPSFEAGSLLWFLANGTATTTTDPVYAGDLALQFTSSATSGTITSSRVPVKAGTTYSASVQMRSLLGSRTGKLSINWFDTLGNLVGTEQSTTATFGTSWAVTQVTATAPTSISNQKNVAYASVSMLINSGNNLDTVYMDAALLEPTAAVGAFFDGTTANGLWLGAPTISASTLNTNDGGTNYCTATGTASSCQISATPDSIYYTQVAGKNDAGWGTASTWSLTKTPQVALFTIILDQLGS